MLKILFSWCKNFLVLKKILVFYSVILVGFNFWVILVIGDLFCKINFIEIGEKIEVVFEVMFEEGNYKEVRDYFKIVECEEIGEFFIYVMIFFLYYLDKNWDLLKLYV